MIPASLEKSGKYGSPSGRTWRQRKEETIEKGDMKRGDPISHRMPGLLEESSDFLGHRTRTHCPVSPSIKKLEEEEAAAAAIEEWDAALSVRYVLRRVAREAEKIF